MRHEDGAPPAACGRRAVLTGAAAAAGLVTAACAGPATTTGGASTVDVPPPGATTGGSGATGTVLGVAADVPVGGGVVYQELEVVVTQPAPGDYRGLSAICTHTGCIVNKVADGTIDCPCHGSRYGLDGSVRAGPAPRALMARPVRVENGRIVLT